MTIAKRSDNIVATMIIAMVAVMGLLWLLLWNCYGCYVAMVAAKGLLWLLLWDCYNCYHGMTMVVAIVATIGLL